MRYSIKTLDDLDLKGKKVLLRVDINEPIDRIKGGLKDITRIEASLPTIKELKEKGAAVIILAHQGSDIEYENFYTTEPHQRVISQLLGEEIDFIDDVCGPAARKKIRELKAGEVLLLDNVRYMAEEQTLFELKLQLNHKRQSETKVVQSLAPLADYFVCDAFAAAHRDQPSLCGFPQLLPSAMGRLFEKEYSVISNIMENPTPPCVFILGGAKIADAFAMMDSVLSGEIADKVLTGGLVANVLLLAKDVDIGQASKKFIEEKGYLPLVAGGKELLDEYGDKILLPKDFAYISEYKRKERDIGNFHSEELMVDIGSKTVEIYRELIEKAQVVFVNGPMGVFEEKESELGTKKIWDALGTTKAFTVIGGGDSIAATNKYVKKENIDYICTGGGALIRFLSGEDLPVMKALRHGSLLEKKQI